MKIVIDCRMYGLEHAGIGRYVENLVRELSKRQRQSRGKGFELVLFFRRKDKKRLTIEPFDHLTIIEADYPHYSLREQIFLPWILYRAKCDLVHFPHFNVPIFYPGKYVVTIHDLIKHASRGRETTTKAPLLYWLKYLGYRVVFWNAVKRAKKILVPSEWVKNELIKQYHLEPAKVVVTYEGVDEKLRIANCELRIKNAILEKYKIKKPFVVYTGSLYPHKNIERLIKATKSLNLSLVIVCSRNVFWERIRKRVEELGAEKFVNLVGFVPDEELVKIYQEAVALVQPSLMEGFDLTVVEAMTAGLPVIVSDIPVHREICGQAALYFDPKSIDDISSKLELVSRDLNLRNKLRDFGFNQAKKYDWKKTVRQTLKVYQST